MGNKLNIPPAPSLIFKYESNRGKDNFIAKLQRLLEPNQDDLNLQTRLVKVGRDHGLPLPLLFTFASLIKAGEFKTDTKQGYITHFVELCKEGSDYTPVFYFFLRSLLGGENIPQLDVVGDVRHLLLNFHEQNLASWQGFSSTIDRNAGCSNRDEHSEFMSTLRILVHTCANIEKTLPLGEETEKNINSIYLGISVAVPDITKKEGSAAALETLMKEMDAVA
ncbi:MAG: hypothetical protein OXR68_00470 [Alphaproteobacteria bacterium]|nr:hypothetical protein [Alphaproteobacteria bacterium]MDD9919085.1 hypothetical protein [Alphaproteobacteria bacterium]